MDHNPVWSSTAGRESTYEYDLDDEFDLDDSAGVFFTYLIGEPLTIADLSRERSRQFGVMVDIDGVEFDSSRIVDFSIDNSLSGEEFEIGTATLSKLTIRLKTSAPISPNAQVIPYLTMLVGDERVTDWFQMGVFYIDSREQINNVWVYTCYDALVWADVPYISALSYPATMQEVWDEICDDLEYEYDDTVVIDPSYQIQAGPAGYSKRQVLAYIASANSASVYIGKDGTLKFRRFTADDEPVIELDGSDYIRLVQTNPVKTYTRIVVTYNTEDGLTYEAGTGDENHTLHIENPFATQDIADDLLDTLNGFSYTPIQMDARGYPQFEAGDRIGFQRNESIPWDQANIAWEDMHIPWDGIVRYKTNMLHTVFSFKGGLTMGIDAPSKSEQQSEFVVEGTLTQAVNRLNENAVKLGKSYFGVTITRTDGIIVEREDHASKLTINSDILFDWHVGGVRKLYYDDVDDVIKFNGTLEAADGVFTGALQGGSIAIGSGNNVFKADSNGIYLGHATFASAPFRVNMEGKLIASDATITGTINATGGTFSGAITASGTITGGTITGALIQTSASGSYPRIEMNASSRLLKAMGTANDEIQIRANISGNVPALSFHSTSKIVTQVLVGDSFLMAMNGATFQIIGPSGSSIFMDASGNIHLDTSIGSVLINGVPI